MVDTAIMLRKASSEYQIKPNMNSMDKWAGQNPSQGKKMMAARFTSPRSSEVYCVYMLLCSCENNLTSQFAGKYYASPAQPIK